MRTWIYNEPIFGPAGEIVGNNIEEFTDNDIIVEYWDHWVKMMENVHGDDSRLITRENCIQDWVTVNLAWEKTDV